MLRIKSELWYFVRLTNSNRWVVPQILLLIDMVAVTPKVGASVCDFMLHQMPASPCSIRFSVLYSLRNIHGL